jgi:hypothetical protein
MDRKLAPQFDQSNARELPPEESRELITGLLAGLTLVGRPRDMHRSMERLANAGVTTTEAACLVR